MAAETAYDQIAAALCLFRPNGRLADRSWAQSQFDEALAILSGEEWAKARRLLNDPRTLNHLDWLHQQLEQAVDEPLLREALSRL